MNFFLGVGLNLCSGGLSSLMVPIQCIRPSSCHLPSSARAFSPSSHPSGP